MARMSEIERLNNSAKMNAEASKALRVWSKGSKKAKKSWAKYKPSVAPKDPKAHWVKIQREYLKWRKTEDFSRWKKKQFLKQGGTCYYCNNPIYGIKVNVEHIVPKSKGGTNSKRNLVLSCSDCNKEKNTKLLSNKEKSHLKRVNQVKKGTYLQTRSAIPTEEDIALKIREMFQE